MLTDLEKKEFHDKKDNVNQNVAPDIHEKIGKAKPGRPKRIVPAPEVKQEEHIEEKPILEDKKQISHEKIDIAKKVEALRSTMRDLTTKGPLYFPPELLRTGYVPRWVNSNVGNIEFFKKLGYTLVIDPLKIGDGHANQTNDLGSAYTHRGRDGVTLVLMEVPRELAEEIQKINQEKVKQSEQAIGKIHGVSSHEQYGTIKQFKK